MNEWNDPRRHRTMRAECDDVMHPYASHPDCDRIIGKYHEGSWFVRISAQTINPHQPIKVAVGVPTFAPHEKDDELEDKLIHRLIKLPLSLMVGKI